VRLASGAQRTQELSWRFGNLERPDEIVIVASLNYPVTLSTSMDPLEYAEALRQRATRGRGTKTQKRIRAV